MEIDDFNWNELYSNVEKHLILNNISAIVCRNEKAVHGTNAIVRIQIQQKGNKEAIQKLNKSNSFFRGIGTNVNGVRMLEFNCLVNQLN